ncbi:hypothetical protein OSB04_023454 [Centaurea solstitialis]|uniref:BED-type domain-containing protein n=1 Tax=Centaurea solstitialis TaxID=347529 RepID=A0AA38T2Q7_9ASTR|nr:hypothetical protein OSB04_023454 [Centaurea solstitialis]
MIVRKATDTGYIRTLVISSGDQLRPIAPANSSDNQLRQFEMATRKDPAWKYNDEIAVPRDGAKKGYKYLKCKFCNKEITGGVKRAKEHLAQTHKGVSICPNVPPEVKDEIVQYLSAYFVGGNASNPPCPNVGGSSRGIRGPMDRFVEDVGNGENASPSPTHPKEHRNQVCMDIGRLFFENGIPFNVATSPSFANATRSIGNYGRRLKPPTMYELRTWILKEEVKTTDEIVNDIKATWKETGVSLLSDGWSDMRNRSLINFLVNNRYGTVFLKTIDVSDCVKNAQKLFELLDQVIEEIGENIVVQVVTDNASAYKAAGNMLMEKRKALYWTPCAAHCIDLMLEKIGELPQQKNALIKAKRLKQGLQTMFISNEWSNCAWENKPEGKAIKKIVMDDRNFWPSVVYSIKTTKPLVHVLRIVDGETPAMGFIYDAMDEAKERIAKNLDDDVSSYKEIWDIIDAKWDHQLHRDLHASGYFLNPQFRWSNDSSNHPEITRGLFACMERLVKNDVMYSKIEE